MILKRLRDNAREIAMKMKWFTYVKLYGAHIHKDTRISYGARIDRSKNIYIGKHTVIASGAIVLAHDYFRGLSMKTTIGERCFIGVNAIIMPGVTLGDECVVGSAAVVTHDLPPHTMVAGNPAKVIKTDVHVNEHGQLVKTAKKSTENDS